MRTLTPRLCYKMYTSSSRTEMARGTPLIRTLILCVSPFRSASGHADTADHWYHGQHLATRRPGPQVIPSTLILILPFSHSLLPIFPCALISVSPYIHSFIPVLSCTHSLSFLHCYGLIVFIPSFSCTSFPHSLIPS